MEGKITLWNSWKCGICGKEYPTIEERMECEQKCKIEKLKVEIEKQKRKCWDLKKRLYELDLEERILRDILGI